jgi:hypothetical protein
MARDVLLDRRSDPLGLLRQDVNGSGLDEGRKTNLQARIRWWSRRCQGERRRMSAAAMLRCYWASIDPGLTLAERRRAADGLMRAMRTWELREVGRVERDDKGGHDFMDAPAAQRSPLWASPPAPRRRRSQEAEPEDETEFQENGSSEMDDEPGDSAA